VKNVWMHLWGYCFRTDGGVSVIIAGYKPFDWELDKWYDVRLTVEGDLFKLYVDNELVIEYIDNT